MKRIDIIERKDVYQSQCCTCQHSKCSHIDCAHCICLYETEEIEDEFNCHCFDLVTSNITDKLPNCGFYIKK